MKPRLVRLALLIVLAIVAYVLQLGRPPGEGDPLPPGDVPTSSEAQDSDGAASSPPDHSFADGEARVLEAFARGQSDFVTEVEARVIRLLPDDEDGDRHQKFIIELSGGHTLLVAHNIDLSDRVPAKTGDRIRIRGEYEYNGRGGVFHWTHRAHGRNHEDGWIEHKGVRYW